MEYSIIDYASTRVDIKKIIKNYSKNANSFEFKGTVDEISNGSISDKVDIQKYEGFYTSEVEIFEPLGIIKFGGFVVSKQKQRSNFKDSFWNSYNEKNIDIDKKWEFYPSPLIAYLVPKQRNILFEYRHSYFGIKKVRYFAEKLLSICKIPIDSKSFNIKRFKSANVESFRERVCEANIAKTFKLQARTEDGKITIDTGEKDSEGGQSVLKDVIETKAFGLIEEIRDDPENRIIISLIFNDNKSDVRSNSIEYILAFTSLPSSDMKRDQGNPVFHLIPTGGSHENKLQCIIDLTQCLNKYNLECRYISSPSSLREYV